MLSVASAAGMPGKARRHPDSTRLSELQAVVLMEAIHAEFQRASARDACTASCGTEAIASG